MIRKEWIFYEEEAEEHSRLARRLAAEGMVLLNHGLKEAGATLVSEGWLEDYEKCYAMARNEWKEKILEAAKHVENPFDAYAANPFVLPEGRMIAEEDVEGAKIAVYVISRISGEGKDRSAVGGDYYLSKREQDEILYLDQRNIPIVLILNAGGPIELTDILEEAKNVRAIINISQPGQEGGHAVADVLFGKAVPGGRLTATWAKRYEEYPYAENFGSLNGNLEKEEYREGIYVGYRYFDSFGIQPLFPFGYGLSYTSFEMRFEELRVVDNNIEADVMVENTGDSYSGREVVQIYVTLPQTENVREYHRLVGFAKTIVLQPGESQKVTVTIQQKQLASFSEETHEWLIEKGLYGVWIGKHSASLQMVAVLKVPEQTVLERTHAICPQKEKFEELVGSELLEQKAAEWIRAAKEQEIPEFEFVPKEEKRQICPTRFEAEKPIKELIPLLYGNITQGASTLGNAGRRVPGSAGETTEALEEKYGIRSLIMADGPAGLRLRQNYEVDRQTDMVYGIGVLGSLENGFLEPTVHHEGVDEYYSEDPLLAGKMAAAVTVGVQSQKGCGVTIKHFACNNQEDNRMGVDVRVSERALREIYLRGFEIAVKESAPAAIMTSYNLINGVHSANNRDLCTVLAREEWGFEGVIMSDWNTTVPEDGSIPWQCVAAGNDIIMPGNEEDDRNIREAYEKGQLSEECIRSCAGRIIDLAKRLNQ